MNLMREENFINPPNVVLQHMVAGAQDLEVNRPYEQMPDKVL